MASRQEASNDRENLFKEDIIPRSTQGCVFNRMGWGSQCCLWIRENALKGKEERSCHK